MQDRVLLLTYLGILHVTHCRDAAYDFDPDQVCSTSTPFHIDRYATATSDSFRDGEYTKLIFPAAEKEYAPNFKQDFCARSSKTSLPASSCFKIHSPQSTQHSEGYLPVQSLENEFSKKFYSVINGDAHDPDYDAFFDYNLGLWTADLHPYLRRINEHHQELTDYIGLKWTYPSPVDRTFYSLIIHSPASLKVYELISFEKPDLSLYPNLRSNFRFREINELRASFLAYNLDEGEFPWTRDDGADLVPIKISYGCPNIEENIEFYIKAMEGTLLLHHRDVESSLDGHSVSYAFLKVLDSQIEIEYVQRPMDYTYGSFTTEMYKNLLLSTHQSRITSPSCGLDRWFDNHYTLSTLSLADDPLHFNYVDRVLGHILARGLKWRLYKAESSPDGELLMKRYGFEDIYSLYIFDMNGQTIQLLGEFTDYVPFDPPTFNEQWCATPCPGHQTMGGFDRNEVYVEDTDDAVYKAVVKLNRKYYRNDLKIEQMENTVLQNQIIRPNPIDNSTMDKIVKKAAHKKNNNIYIVTLGCVTIGVVICIVAMICVYGCIPIDSAEGDDEGHLTKNVIPLASAYDEELQSLLQSAS